jgi:beta-lactamase class A
MMIIVSDNTCTGLVVDLVGLESIQRWCEAVGMTGTTHRFGIPPKLGREHTLEQVTTTTPEDSGMLLELILQGTSDPAVARKLGSTPELCRLGLDILSWQKLKARLPSQLPLGTRIAHKTGTGSRGFMDAGIIFKGERPLCVLAIYTEHVPEALPDGTPGFTAANQLMGRMARACYDHLGG